MPGQPTTEAIVNPQLSATRLKYRFIRESTAMLANTRGGIDILNSDWDNLIILDACRYDYFSALNHSSGTLHCKLSRGASTPEFVKMNFGNRTAYDTIYISSNAMIGELSELIDVYKLIGLWEEQARLRHHEPSTNSEQDRNSRHSQTHPASLTDPGPVIDRTIQVRDNHPHKRLITHFLQPHTPFLVKDGKRLHQDSPYRTFEAVSEGKISQSEMQKVYEENVNFVLDEVYKLTGQLHGKTVITADHGELLGEGVPRYVEILHPRWPMSDRDRFDFGHYGGVRVPELVHVPWLVLESSNRPDIHEADNSEGVEMDESSINDQLAALGYR